MTREEALYCMKANSILHSEICEECPLYGDTGVDHCFEDALDEAIKALEQEPCKDAISREDALMALTGEWTDSTELIYRFIRQIRTLPSVDPQPKMGQWQQDLDGTYLCSECGSGFKEQPTLMGKPMFAWCPLCGAKMVEPKESEESE